MLELNVEFESGLCHIHHAHIELVRFLWGFFLIIRLQQSGWFFICGIQ